MTTPTTNAAGKASLDPLVRRLETVSFRLRQTQRGKKWTRRDHDADILDNEIIPVMRSLANAGNQGLAPQGEHHA